MNWETRQEPTPYGWRLSLRVDLDVRDLIRLDVSREERQILDQAGTGQLVPVLNAIMVVARALDRERAEREGDHG